MERQLDPRDHGVVPLARIGLGSRRRRQLARRFGREARRDPGVEQLFDDLAAIDTVPGPTWRQSERYDTIDPGERALLVQLYRELLVTVEGPVLPFPVELVLGEDEAPELDEPAQVLSFDAFRRERTTSATPVEAAVVADDAGYEDAGHADAEETPTAQ